MTREERAQQLWSILVLAARNRQIWTYEIIGQACGVPPPSIGDLLRPIQQYCSEKGLPPLTSIVVGKSGGQPGDGFIGGARCSAGRQMEVFERDWLAERAPTAERLAECLFAGAATTVRLWLTRGVSDRQIPCTSSASADNYGATIRQGESRETHAAGRGGQYFESLKAKIRCVLI